LAASLGHHEPLHDAVLQRVVRDRDEAPADSERRHRLRQGRGERIELAVDLDAERLKGAARRVRPDPTRRVWNSISDELDELDGRGERLPTSCPDDELRDPRRPT